MVKFRRNRWLAFPGITWIMKVKYKAFYQVHKMGISQASNLRTWVISEAFRNCLCDRHPIEKIIMVWRIAAAVLALATFNCPDFSILAECACVKHFTTTSCESIAVR